MNDYNSEYQVNDLNLRDIDPYIHSKYKLLQKHLPKNRHIKILNVGAGHGDLSFLLQRDGHFVTNLEPDQENIKMIQNKSSKYSLSNSTNVHTNLEDFTTTERFDCIISTEVLEHIDNDQFAVKKMLTLLTDDGLLLITVPALPFLFGNHDIQLKHKRRYTKKSLLALFDQTLGNINVRYFGFFFIPIAIYYSKIIKKYYPFQEIESNITVKSLVRIILNLEELLAFPIGTSLILIGRRK